LWECNSKQPLPFISKTFFVSFRFTLGSLVMMPFTAAKEPFTSSHAHQHRQDKDEGFGMTGAESH
jgi:hypothetical protein